MYMKISAMVFESNLQSVLKLGFTFWRAKQQHDSSQGWIFILFNIISLKTCMKKLEKNRRLYPQQWSCICQGYKSQSNGRSVRCLLQELQLLQKELLKINSCAGLRTENTGRHQEAGFIHTFTKIYWIFTMYPRKMQK